MRVQIPTNLHNINEKMENAPSKVHSPFSIFNSQLLEDFFQRCNQLIHLLICADGNTQVIINARQLEIADKDTLFAQGGEDIRRFLLRVGDKQEVCQRRQHGKAERPQRLRRATCRA